MIALASAGTGVWFRKGGEFSQLYAPTPASPAQITAVAFRGEDVVAFSREPALLHFLRAPGSPRLTVMLDGRSIRSTGHDLFHASTTSAIACASCHPEAGEDGHVWRLPEGPRRTPSLRGGLIGTEPFHWSGDQQTMGTLLADVLVKRMGGDSPSAARGAAALKWLDAQPKLPAPRLDGSAVARGKALFAAPAIGCASCHAGELGTNNTNANVGTELSLQVPRLVELAYRAPFFHDGRVPTLAARFTAVGGGDAHGHVSQLKSDEVADLVAYLKSR